MSDIIIKKKYIKKYDIINVKGGISAKDVYAKYKPDAFCNLALYASDVMINITRLEDENVSSGYLFSDEVLGIKGDNEIVWVDYGDAFADKEIRDAVGGSPILGVKDKMNIRWGNKHSAYVDKTWQRTAIGDNDSEFIMHTSDEALTIPELATIMTYNKHCKNSLACDGGGSSHLQMGQRALKESTRANVSWFLIYFDKTQMFVDIVTDQILKDYIYAANGEVITQSTLNKFISWFGKKNYISAYFDARKNVNDVQDFDCSGLFVYAMRQLGWISGTADYTAKGLFGLCNKINKSELQNGDLIFRNNLGHVAMYLDGYAFHAKGTSYGVTVTDDVDTFNLFGRLKFVE